MPRAKNQFQAAIARELRERGYDRVRVVGNKVIGCERGYDMSTIFTLIAQGATLLLFDGWGSVPPYDTTPLITTVDLADPTSLDRLFKTIDEHYPLGR